MPLNHNSSEFLPTYGEIILIGFSISVIIILSLIPIYIENRSVEIPARSPSVYLLYNVTFHVTPLSTRNSRAAPSSLNATAFTLNTLLAIQNQLNQNFAAIQASCIITAATYQSDVSNLILTLKITFYNPCVDATSTCAKMQLREVNNILQQLQSLTINGGCYSSCVSTPSTCSFLATIVGPPSAFTVVNPSNDQGPVQDPCANTTSTASSTIFG